MLTVVPQSIRADGAIEFGRDIRPILAAKCFACHGPDEKSREAGLRLDQREGATAELDSGAGRALVAGKPDESVLYQRITAQDESERMPPPDGKEQLSGEQIDLLRRWIEGGGAYGQHWSFELPQKAPLPMVTDASWPRNPIDHFVLARLEAVGLHPSPEADRYTLARRLYLDLIGLPPTPEEADAFVQDSSPTAYESLVDRLLGSPHYGERWARLWLDLVRYADTNGYEKDRPRSIWPYRDWVIGALNDDLPFDRFTVEQLAGDMLPDATPAQRIATGFHRNTMLNEEGGIDPLEFRFYAMVDRVATTGTVWLGLTVGCAQCHTHKYDPISQTDYYRLMALLDNADEPDLTIHDADVAERRAELESRIAGLESELAKQFPPVPGDGPVEDRRQEHLEQKFAEWLTSARAGAVPWQVLRPHAWQTNLPKLEVLEDGSVFSSGDFTKRDLFTLRFQLSEFGKAITSLRLEVLPDERLPGHGPGRAFYEGRQGDFFLSEFKARVDGAPLRFASASHSYGKISIGSGDAKAENVFDGDGSTGWSTAEREGEPHWLVLNLAEPLTPAGELEIELLFERHFAASLGRFRLSATTAEQAAKASDLPVDLESLLAAKSSVPLTNQDRARLLQHYLGVAPELADARREIEQLRKQLPAYPKTLVMQERPADNPRITHRHERGEYLKPQEQVQPSVLEIFASSERTRPTNRLEFAHWLVSDDNPLVGRVVVNRAWQACFGTGLVRTSSDFGTQGSPPSHPELLDWLARALMEEGWSLKRLHRLIVTSATYRQSSRITSEALQRDPENRWLGRAPRLRADAELIRDLALRASGAMTETMGGPSVYPPQPASVTALAYGSTEWQPSSGADRYRRSLYTFSKRTAPFAAYLVFDGPTGENCVPQRERSNTPLQALTLLNDQMFVELSRLLAAEASARHPSSAAERATFIFRRFLTRLPTASELAALTDYQLAQQRRLESGELQLDDSSTTPELVAWSMVVRVVMNLDETITRN